MLDPKKRYLQIALNSTLDEARRIIFQLPVSDRILVEAGTPLIKRYGSRGIWSIKSWWGQRLGLAQYIPNSKSQNQKLPGLIGIITQAMKESRKTQQLKQQGPQLGIEPYVIADLKCMDRGNTEVEIARAGGANAAVALGHAPIETLDAFIENCKKSGLDSMIDMMNVSFPLEILRQLKELPKVVVLHRGVDEESYNREKEIPFHEVARIKSQYDIIIAVAGGDTIQEVQRAAFNDTDIVVVWKSFYKSGGETAKLAEDFLKEVR